METRGALLKVIMHHHSLVVSFAQKEQQPPRLHCGQDEGCNPDKCDEAAGALWSPLIHDEALFRHGDVLVLPHSTREKQAFPTEVLRVLGQRHNGDEAEHKGQEIEDALSEDQVVQGHLGGSACCLPEKVRLRSGDGGAASEDAP